ncbi:MAG: metallophosphoesterase [Acidobacteriota bacterium]
MNRALCIADRVDEIVHSTHVRRHFPELDVVFACGDLPYSYVEYAMSALDVPVFYVRGNHDKVLEEGPGGPITGPAGARDLHRRVRRHAGLLLAGVEGSVRYKPGPFQYSQRQMWRHVFALVPQLLWNRARRGRALDVFVTHAPPRSIHDRDDLPHHGIDAFRWLLRRFRPALHVHGHVHVWGPNTVTDTRFAATRVLNAYGHRVVELQTPATRDGRTEVEPCA